MDEKITFLKRYSPNIEMLKISSLDKLQFDMLPLYWQEAFKAHSSGKNLTSFSPNGRTMTISFKQFILTSKIT